MMKPIGKGVLLSDNSSNKIIDEVISVLRKNDFDDAMISQFTDNAVKVLNDYAGLVGEGILKSNELSFGKSNCVDLLDDVVSV